MLRYFHMSLGCQAKVKTFLISTWCISYYPTIKIYTNCFYNYIPFIVELTQSFGFTDILLSATQSKTYRLLHAVDIEDNKKSIVDTVTSTLNANNPWVCPFFCRKYELLCLRCRIYSMTSWQFKPPAVWGKIQPMQWFTNIVNSNSLWNLSLTNISWHSQKK